MADIKIGLGSFAETAVASAATCDIGAATTQRVRITGNVTITSFGTAANRRRHVRFIDPLTLTHGAALDLPTGANIAVEAGDTCMAVSGVGGDWIVTEYQRRSGVPLSNQLPTYTVATLPSAATARKLIYVSDESGGAVPAFSDGANWRRMTDRAIVS